MTKCWKNNEYVRVHYHPKKNISINLYEKQKGRIKCRTIRVQMKKVRNKCNRSVMKAEYGLCNMLVIMDMKRLSKHLEMIVNEVVHIYLLCQLCLQIDNMKLSLNMILCVIIFRSTFLSCAELCLFTIFKNETIIDLCVNYFCTGPNFARFSSW